MKSDPEYAAKKRAEQAEKEAEAAKALELTDDQKAKLVEELDATKTETDPATALE